MKGHLTSEQLVDLAEHLRPEWFDQATRHLHSCSACRQQLADLQAATSAALEGTVPEPSPLFWDHLSARIHDAVETEWARESSGLKRWFTRPVSRFWAGAAAAPVVAVCAVAIVMHLARERGPASPAASGTGVEVAEMLGAEDDASLSLIADLAADLDWDAASDAGLMAHVGVDNDAVAQLTDAERRELRQLLNGLARPGAGG